MPPRNRQRQRVFTQPPADLPADDPYGDAPPPTPAAGEGKATAAVQDTSEPRTDAKKRAKPASRKSAEEKTPLPVPASGGSGVGTAARARTSGGAIHQVQLYIPAALHQAIADYKAEHWRGNEAPTYAQLSVWACEDHREEVLERAVKVHQLRHGSTTDVRGDRAPRGTRRARPQVPIGPRYSPGDAQFLEQMAAAAGPIDDVPVKRTTLVAAALAVAVKHEPTIRQEPAAEPEDEFFG